MAAYKLSLIIAKRTRYFLVFCSTDDEVAENSIIMIIHWRKRSLAPCFTENALIMQLRCIIVGLDGHALLYIQTSLHLAPFGI